jgi:hypothetical protein
MITSRRGFILGLGAALAAPAIVKAEGLMKIAVLRQELNEASLREALLAYPAPDVTVTELFLRYQQAQWEMTATYRRLREYLFQSSVPVSAPSWQEIIKNAS